MFATIGNGPGGVGTTTRSLTQAIELDDWRATVNGTRHCSASGCGSSGRLTKNLCPTHYARLRRHGSVGTQPIRRARYESGATCAADDCTKKPSSLDLCTAHYKRVRKYGAPDLPAPQPIGEYMGAREVLGDPPASRPGLGACLEWAGTRYANGYRAVGLRSHHKMLAHRVAYQLANGDIPEGMVVDHLCRNRGCVNPSHLEVVTNEENLRRGKGFRLRNGMDSKCVHGHAYTPENTYINPNKPSHRSCRECARIRNRARSK